MNDEKTTSESGKEPSPERKRRFAGWPARFIGSLQDLENAITREHAGYKTALRIGVAVSLLVHILALIFVLPRLTGRVSRDIHPELELVVLPPAEEAFTPTPPAVEVPAPQQPMPRPAIPRPADIEDPDWAPPFIPHDTPPRLVNATDVVRILQERYPVDLREQGVGGVVLLWVFVDARGNPTKLQLRQSSGYDGLDRAAQSVGQEMRFRPALNQDQPVGVWVAQQIRFEFRPAEPEEEAEGLEDPGAAAPNSG
jgi:TonB family protein